MTGIIRNTNIEDIENRPIGIVIDFSRFIKLTIRVKEIVQCLLTGTATEQTVFGRCNIVKCKADQFKTTGANLEGVDIKDCFFDNCLFSDTTFSNSATINCNYQASIFKDCSFKYSSITNTTFENVTFEDCDLSNLVMEGCRFIGCLFINCKTSNKLIEESLLYNTAFENMTIDICTILDNFGISKFSATNVRIVDGNGYIMQNAVITDKQLQLLLQHENISNAYKFKISYYLNHKVFDTGGIYIDKIFDIETWLEICKNAVTFNNTLSLFYEFLSFNYEHGDIMLWPLLKLYSLTSQLSNIPNIERQYQIYPNIMGIHMAVVRYVENYYVLLQAYTKSHASNPIVLLVTTGPMDCEFYKQRLIPLLDIEGIEIQRVIKHNSPNELFIALHDFNQSLDGLSFSQLLQNAASLVTIYSGFLMTRKIRDIRSIKQKIRKSHKKPSRISNGDKRKISLNIQDGNKPTKLTISTDSLNDSTQIDIIRPKQLTKTPLSICLKNNSRVICTLGNTIIDVLS